MAVLAVLLLAASWIGALTILLFASRDFRQRLYSSRNFAGIVLVISLVGLTGESVQWLSGYRLHIWDPLAVAGGFYASAILLRSLYLWLGNRKEHL